MKKHLSIAIIVTLTLMSCGDDFLSTSDPNSINEENFFQSEEDATAAIFGVYAHLQVNDLYGFDMTRFESATDNAYNQFTGDGFLPISEGTHISTNIRALTFWRANYTIITRANLVLAEVPGIDMDEVTKNTILGEAYVLRALAYLHLTTLYGDVPLITDPINFDDRFFGQTDRSAVRAQMIEDLELAVDLLPDSNPGRVDKGTGTAMLGKYYLYEGNWDQAAQAFQSVMDMGYELHPDYDELFTVAGESSNEIIFAVKFEAFIGDEGETFARNYAGVRPLPNFVDEFEAIDGLPISESPLFDPDNEFENRDPRLDITVLKGGDEEFEGLPFDPSGSDTGYGYEKYINLDMNAGGPQDFYVIRYADVLLMFAEAQNEDAGPSQAVYDAVNAVRSRVGMPGIPNNLSQDDLREAIRHERRVELGFEGTRLFDIYRWGAVGQTFANVTFHERLYESPKHDRYPIPQDELDNNPLIQPNPGWE